MKIRGFTAALVLLAILSTSCTTLGFKSQKRVKSGQEVSAGFWYHGNSECKSAGFPKIKIESSTMHGTLRFVAGKGYPDYNSRNPLRKCNKNLIDGVWIYYRAPQEYHGEDVVLVKIEWPNGATNYYGSKIMIE